MRRSLEYKQNNHSFLLESVKKTPNENLEVSVNSDDGKFEER